MTKKTRLKIICLLTKGERIEQELVYNCETQALRTALYRFAKFAESWNVSISKLAKKGKLTISITKGDE